MGYSTSGGSSGKLGPQTKKKVQTPRFQRLYTVQIESTDMSTDIKEKWMEMFFHALTLILTYGGGSKPIIINSNGMNIHLPAILGFTRCQGFDQ